MDKESFVAAVREVEGATFSGKMAHAKGEGFFALGKIVGVMPIYTANDDPQDRQSFARTEIDAGDVSIDNWGTHCTAGGFRITALGDAVKINDREAKNFKP